MKLNKLKNKIKIFKQFFKYLYYRRMTIIFKNVEYSIDEDRNIKEKREGFTLSPLFIFKKIISIYKASNITVKYADVDIDTFIDLSYNFTNRDKIRVNNEK